MTRRKGMKGTLQSVWKPTRYLEVRLGRKAMSSGTFASAHRLEEIV